MPAPAILDAYVLTLPTSQNAIDIFDGEWSSKFPAPCDALRAGHAELFTDARMTWLIEHLGDISGYRILELGPLKGGHTYSLTRAGASVVAVEAQTRAYLRCLITKEILGIAGARFLLGDFVEYLRQAHESFDLCVASGVLYHMRNPVEVLELIGRHASRVMLWTHYYDEARAATDSAFGRKFSAHNEHEYAGKSYTLHRFEYLEALDHAGFCGGSARFAEWLCREDLLGILDHLGWTVEAVNFDHPDHIHGPALALIAQREEPRKERVIR